MDVSTLSRWCDALRSAPARDPKGCDYVISHTRARTKGRCWENENVDEAVSRVGFHGNRSSFLGYGHDWWLYHNHAKYLERPGVYLDLATNDPIERNNAFFVDRCLGWRGLCFEPGHRHHERIRNLRSCQLVPTCVSNNGNAKVRFATGSNKSYGGDGHLLDTMYARHAKRENTNGILTMRCTTLVKALAEANLSHVDFLSLDLEGHELPALLSMDFTATTVDIIMSEDATVWKVSPAGVGGPRSVSELLVRRHNYSKLVKVLKARDGDVRFQNDDVYLRPGFQLAAERHGQLQIDGPWRCLYKEDGRFQPIRGITDYGR